jgi:2-iminobutanoate/2-iminopropanoate deaminase
MTDLGEFQAVNEVYAEFFSQPYPARSTVEVKALPKGVKVEIEAIAVK